MRILVWLFRAFLFFTLFAFALNNLQSTTVNWFFGVRWSAPMVIVVLAAFGVGCAVGVLGMVPSWWRQRRRARLAPTPAAPASPSVGNVTGPASDLPLDHPPREGL